MKITLLIEGKNKEIVQDFISGLALRKTLEMQKKISAKQNSVDETTLDSMADYIVYLFGAQFTRDQFYDGIRASDLISTVVRCIDEVVSGVGEAVGADPDAPNV
ncbi:hypothetical protein D3C73_525770 [compost metagenome]